MANTQLRTAFVGFLFAALLVALGWLGNCVLANESRSTVNSVQITNVKEVINSKLEDIQKRLDRIERKIDEDRKFAPSNLAVDEE